MMCKAGMPHMQTGEISNLILLLSACGVTTIAPGERFQSGNMSVSAESLTDEETKCAGGG